MAEQQRVTTRKARRERAAAPVTEEQVTDSVEPTERTLTLEDINSSEYLRKNGVLAGDLFKDGKIIRKYSKDEDAVTQGKILTEADVISSPYLQEQGIVAGDRFYDGKLYRSKEDDAWTQFKYAVDKAGNTLSYAADLLEIYMPMKAGGGRLTSEYGIPERTVDEKNEEGFLAASTDERREMILRKRERDLQEEYGQFFQEDADSKAATLGAITKTLADPVALAIPAGGTVKAATALGGMFGGAYSALQDVAETGEVDPVKTAISTLAGGGLGGVTRKAVQAVGSRSANKLVDKAQARAYELTAEGKTTGEALTQLAEEGFNGAKLTAAMSNTGRKIKFPANADSAAKAIDNAIANDSAVSRLYSKTLDKYLGSLSTRIRNISQPVFGRLRKFEFNTHKKTQDLVNTTEPFLAGINKLSGTQKDEIARQLYNGNFKAARGLMPEEVRASFSNVVEPLLSKMGDDLLETGHAFTKVDNYFPRLVKDLKGLEKSLGKKDRGVFDKAIRDYAKSKGTSVGKLTPEERGAVLDLQLRGYGMKVDGGKPRFVKERQIEQVSPEQMKYYASPEESLSMYIRGAINDIEKRKFFGRDTALGKDSIVDYDSSVGNLVAKEVEAGNIPTERQGELEELLRARFIGGEQTPHTANSTLRDLGYMGTIANPISAITQLGDLGTTGALKGFKNTIASMFGEKNVKLIDVGLDDAVAKELTHGDARLTARALNKAMGLVGFKRLDRLSKETHMNASLRKARGLVKTPKGESAFRKEWGKVYGDEIDAIVSDLKAGNISENVKLHMFNELADIQPIALSEMPEAYLTAPNGRILYMLKSFTLKQYDIVRRNIVQEYAKGNKAQAIKNATLYAGYLTAANTGTQAVKDMILGREVRPEDVPDRALWALLGVFGLNKYTTERYIKQGDITGAALNLITPATPLIQSTIKLGQEAFEDEPEYPKAMKGIPVVGTLFYNWFGGGAERFNERLDKD